MFKQVICHKAQLQCEIKTIRKTTPIELRKRECKHVFNDDRASGEILYLCCVLMLTIKVYKYGWWWISILNESECVNVSSKRV